MVLAHFVLLEGRVKQRMLKGLKRFKLKLVRMRKRKVE